MMLIAYAGTKKQELTASYTLATGEALLSCIALKINGKYVSKVTYTWQKSIDGGITWVNIYSGPESKYLVKGLTPGVVMKFRKRSVSTKGGATAWCKAVDFTAK